VWATIVSVLATFRIAKAKDVDGNEIDIDPLYSDGLLRYIFLSIRDLRFLNLTCSHPGPFQCSISPRSEAAKKLVQGTLAAEGQ
jgi:hypothetical protein